MMPEESHNNDNAKTAKSKRKRISLAAVVIVLTAIIACFIWSTWNSKSVEQQLAAIEAARAIPDAENAAVLYNKLMQDPNATTLLAELPQFILNTTSDQLALIAPWQSDDYARLAAWVEEKQPVVDAILEAANFDKCRFQIEMPLPANQAMRRWTFLLRLAVIDDIANDRIDDAIEKWRCLLQMGNHLRQQPLFDAHIVAMGIEAIALRQTTTFLVQGNAGEAHLQRIEALPLHTKDNWAAALEEITPAEELAEENWKGQMGFIERIKYTFGYAGFRAKDRDIGRVSRLYYELLARSRGLHVLVALRRYKNKNGRWPETLDQIKPQVPAEMFLDPFGSPLAYKLTNDTFTLYSKGPNKIDENGNRRNGCDDCPIWVPPAQKQETKQQNADPNQPETIKEPN